MPRPITATLDLLNLSSNLQHVRNRISSNTELMAVVKANAYGHRLELVYPALGGADSIALLDLAEAGLLRVMGWYRSILLLEGAFEFSDYAAIANLKLDFTLHNDEQFMSLKRFLSASPPLLESRVFVKINTGMNRLGYTPERGLAVMLELMTLHHQEFIGPVVLMTHFANSDVADPLGPSAIEQAAVLKQMSSDIRERAAKAGLKSCNFITSLANSAGALYYGQEAGQIQRIGIAAYGSSTSPVSAQKEGLKPVMRLATRLISIQHLKTGERIGYGSRFLAEKPMRIGVAACGYADGYPRHAPDGTPVLVNGVRARIAGRVSMDMITIDLTDVPTADIGSEVVLFGDEQLGVDEVAAVCGTIGYELLCAVSQRVRFSVVDR
jgi:alanine racemase